jgi:inner membrane protein
VSNVITVIIPARNEEKTIYAVVRAASLQAGEVIVIDDGSVDATAQIAGEAGARVLITVCYNWGMYMLAHTGITLGVGYAVDKSVRSPLLRVDYRFILLGALLPDLIDKPLGRVIFAQELANGRIFAHTLLFMLLVTLVGIVVYRLKGQQGGLCLAFGVLMHFLLDSIWLNPVTLFWPFLSPEFPKSPAEFSVVFFSWLYTTLTTLQYLMAEIAGGCILLFLAARAILQNKVGAFFRYGTL